MANMEAGAVFCVIQQIPIGQVASYGQIARLAGFPGRARWVGRLLRHQQVPGLAWHRVVRADGKIAFPEQSEQAQLQTTLLSDEGVTVKHGKINLVRYGWQN